MIKFVAEVFYKSLPVQSTILQPALMEEEEESAGA